MKRFLLAKSETIQAFKINPESNGLYNTLTKTEFHVSTLI